jgi:hypothetical protein
LSSPPPRAIAGDRIALAIMAGTAAAVSEASIAPRARTLGPFLIDFDIVFLRSPGAGTISADAAAV